jgi:hypothetical protein
MAADPPQSSPSPLSGDVAARIASIVEAAEREARAVERAIADRRRSAEEEVQRYLAAVRLHADAEAAARAARLESLSGAARRLADELADATAALRQELHRSEEQNAAALPGAPWPPLAADAAPQEPSAPPAPTPEPEPPAPTWTRQQQEAPSAPPAQAPHEPAPAAPAAASAVGEVPSAARLVAIEMAVGGASRADVERQLRNEHGLADPGELLDDVFGATSDAGSTLAWGQP